MGLEGQFGKNPPAPRLMGQQNECANREAPVKALLLKMRPGYRECTPVEILERHRHVWMKGPFVIGSKADLRLQALLQIGLEEIEFRLGFHLHEDHSGGKAVEIPQFQFERRTALCKIAQTLLQSAQSLEREPKGGYQGNVGRRTERMPGMKMIGGVFLESGHLRGNVGRRNNGDEPKWVFHFVTLAPGRL